MQVYHHAEVEAFAKVFYLPRAKRPTGGHARMEAQLQPSRDRFRALGEEEQTAFRDRLGAFVGLYAFLSQIIPLRRRRTSSASPRSAGRSSRTSERTVTTTRCISATTWSSSTTASSRVSSGAVAIGEDGDVYVTSPTEVGTGDRRGDARAALGDHRSAQRPVRHGLHRGEDRLFFQQVKERAVSDELVRSLARANPFDKFALGVRDRIGELMMERMQGNDAIVTRFLDDTEFQEIAADVLAREIFAEVGAAG